MSRETWGRSVLYYAHPSRHDLAARARAVGLERLAKKLADGVSPAEVERLTRRIKAREEGRAL